MTAHLAQDAADVVHVTQQNSGQVHTNHGHPIVGTLQDAVGTLAAIEAADTAAFAGLVGLIGTLAATESADVAAITGLVGRAGTMAATEGADTAAFAGLVSVTGALAAIEAADIGSFAGTVVTLGTLAATDAADIFASTGIVASAGEIIGSLDASEAQDTAAFAGIVPVPVTITVGGGYYPWRLLPVEGAGYGILPRLEGEAHGVVVTANEAAAVLRGLAGDAVGSVGTAGSSAALLALKAAASGEHGARGATDAMLDCPTGTGLGTAVACGRGSGLIANLKADAVGLAGDDEAAAIVWMLAA